MSGVTDAAEVAAGGTHTCARTSVGAVMCTGYNSSGQLGDGTTTRRDAPVSVVWP
ncbi:MAG: RCC1 domain-containing protein [Polyangiales bacterium]